jgi:hypothetical protein
MATVMALSEYQMTRILAQAMRGDVGEALNQYLDGKFKECLNNMLDMGKREEIEGLKMIRSIQVNLEGMHNTLSMMKPE